MGDLLTYIDPRSGITFEWSGGAYVDIYATGADAPFEVLNVYDYRAGRPAIPFTVEALSCAAQEWLTEVWDAEWEAYYRNVIDFQYLS